MQSSGFLVVGAGTLALAFSAAGADRSSLNLTPSGASASDEVRALVAEMLSDAESRSSLLQSSATAGHDGQFFLASPDGSSRLNISGQLQTRYTVATRNDQGNTVDDLQTSFTNPRMVLRFDGKVFDNFIYGIQAVFARNGSGIVLEDAFVGRAFDNGLLLIWGQYREPVLWEDVLNDKFSLAADQSVVNMVFASGYSQGAWAFYSADKWRMWAGLSDGIRSANTDIGADPAELGFTTRWEYKWAGDWTQFDQFSSPRGSEYAGKFGLGFHYEQTTHRPGPLPPAGIGTLETDLIAYTADFMLEGDGWNFFLMGVGLYTDTNGGVGSFSDFGFMAQGGMFLAENIEAFGRYDVVLPDGKRVADGAFNTLTCGINYYLHGQAAKFTFDVQWFPDDVAGNALVAGAITGAPNSVGNRIGLFPSANSNQYVFRAQFQLLF